MNYTDEQIEQIEDLIMDVIMDEKLWSAWDLPKRVKKLKKYIFDHAELSDIDYITSELCDILSEEGLTESSNDNIMSYYQYLIDNNMMDK